MLFKTTVHVHDCTARITTKSVCITQWGFFQVLSTELLQKKKNQRYPYLRKGVIVIKKPKMQQQSTINVPKTIYA